MNRRKTNAKELSNFRPPDVFAVSKFVFQMGYTTKETKSLSGMSLPNVRDIRDAILAAVAKGETKGLSKATVKAAQKMLA